MSKINYKKTLSLKYASSIFNYIIDSDFKDVFDISLSKSFENFNSQNFSENKKNISTLQIVTDELRLINFSILEIKNFFEILKDPTYSNLEKLSLIFTIFPNLNSLTKAFIKILAEKNHLSLLPDIMIEYNKMFNEFLGIKYFSLVFSAVPKINQLNTIKRSLSNFKLAEKKLKLLDFVSLKMNQLVLDIIYDSSLLGGFVIYEGSRKIIDLSLKGKLTQIIQNI